MKKSSAPGKVFLFGEHAVVYDQPAVLCAVDRRVTAKAETRDDDTDVITADDLSVSGLTVSFDRETGETTVRNAGEGVENSLDYVHTAVEKTRSEVGSDMSVEVEIESELPVGAGLGSSAAVVVSTIHAVSRELGEGLERERIAEIGHEVELEVQGSASPSDTFTSTMGGMTYVEPSSDLRTLDTPDFRFVVGYDGKSAPTGEMVAGVRELKESSEVANDLIESIGDITREGVKAAEEGDRERVGELMNLNHGLLESLGVSSASLSRMVWSARDLGAYGAKLTGAGGGGCTVALVDDERIHGVVEGTRVTSEEVYEVEVAEGVRSEP